MGIARIGPSDQIASYMGPDFPNPDFVPFTIPGIFPKPYRDLAGNIRRQAARFRVYRVEWRRAGRGGRGGWVPWRATEVTATGGVTLKWTVTVANFKSFKADWPPDTPANKDNPNRIENADSAQIAGVSQPSKDLIGNATFPNSTFPSNATKADLLLGQIGTDDKGRLIFFAGVGECRNVGGVPLGGGLFHRGWFDDVCDGSIDCEIDDGTHPPERAERAWIVTGAPAYAHQIGHLVTLYDVAETIAAHKHQLPPARPSIVHHIYPVLRATELQRWVTDAVVGMHKRPFNPEGLLREPGTLGALPPAEHRKRRREIFERLRNPRTLHVSSGRKNPFLPHWYPVDNNTGVVQNNPDVALAAAMTHPQPSEMPLQVGLPFTLEQWKRFQQWRNGDVNWDYKSPADIPKPPVRLEAIIDSREQVDALNRAHMGAMVGGSTMPGIEVGWKALEAKSWGHAFRPSDSLEPGDLTFSLSVPWPTDFLACSRENVTNNGETVENDWWPAARPLSVISAGATVDWDRPPGVAQNDPDWWKTRGFIAKNAAGDYEEVEKP